LVKPLTLQIVALLGALLSWSGRAPAAPGDATSLEYARSDRAAACPDRSALKAAVVKRLGYDPFFPAARQTIVVEITDQGPELRAQMHLLDESGIIRGSRELRERAEHCDELVASLALAISIALDPSAAMRAEPEPVTASSEQESSLKSAESDQARPDFPPETATPAASAPVPTTTRRAHPTKRQLLAVQTLTHIGLRAGVFSAFDVAPAKAFGWTSGISLRGQWFELIAEFADQLPASQDLPGGRGRAALLASNAAACLSRGPLAACALTSVGSFQSEGQAISAPHRQSSFYAALGARFQYAPQLAGRFHLLLNLDIAKSITPITLRLDGKNVWETPVFSVAVGAGLEALFP
jgi:hypothetical protein